MLSNQCRSAFLQRELAIWWLLCALQLAEQLYVEVYESVYSPRVWQRRKPFMCSPKGYASAVLIRCSPQASPLVTAVH